MSTSPSLKALHDASPRNQPDFDALLVRYEELPTRITSSPLDSAGRSGPPPHRRRLIGLSVGSAVAALAVVLGALTLGGGSPQSAYAAAHEALAATSAQRSGTMTVTVNGAMLSTLRWNGHGIALRNPDGLGRAPRHAARASRQGSAPLAGQRGTSIGVSPLSALR